MAIESDRMREYFGRKVYFEIEERILREALKRPTIKRWRNLCAIMADGVSVAANENDRNLATRGWLCLGSMHLRTHPLWTNRKSILPLHEYSANEIDVIIDAFMPFAKSCKYYLERVYPDFDYDTGKWGRVGQEDKFEAPLPFFLASNFNSNEDIQESSIDCLFDIKEDDSVEEGIVYRLNLGFFDDLAMLTDDKDAELWISKSFAGNTGVDIVRKIVAEIDEFKAAKNWPPSRKCGVCGKEHLTLNKSLRNAKKVFVVHGHDNQLLGKVKTFLQNHSLRPIVLREQPNAGKTIIEKFEYYAHVNYAIVLLTADDIGYAKRAVKVAEERGRQNVVFEMGYFMGKYGRDKMAVLCDDDVAKPGDVDGLVYIPTMGDWGKDLLRELRAAGVAADVP